jgi:hypothetical protein
VPTLEKLAGEGTPHIVLSASMPEDFASYGLTNQTPFAFTDETTLKTMVRSNPGWVVLNKGSVVKKFHHNDSPR